MAWAGLGALGWAESVDRKSDDGNLNLELADRGEGGLGLGWMGWRGVRWGGLEAGGAVCAGPSWVG